MSNLILTVNTMLPILLIMVVGYICRQTNMITPENVNAMNKLVFRVFLPLTFVKNLMSVGGNLDGGISIIVFCVIGTVCIFLAGFFLVPRFVKDRSRCSVIVQGMFRGNSSLMVIPLTEALFPNQSGGMTGLIVLATVPIYNVLAVFVFEYFRGGQCSVKKVLSGVVKNPLIWGCIIGYVLGCMPFDMPEFVLSTVNKLAGISSPLGLFVMGAMLDLGKLGSNARALLCTAVIKLLAAPTALLAVAYLLGFRGFEFAALMIALTAPCPGASYTMAAQMDGDADLAAQLVMLTTVMSILTIFVMIFACKSLGIF